MMSMISFEFKAFLLALSALVLPESSAHLAWRDSVLAPGVFSALPLGAVQPFGWLQRQIDVQAAGLSGHEDEIWPFVAQSQWIGGNSDGWQFAPYALDGIVPLAFLASMNSDGQRLRSFVDRWMNYTISHQAANGWIGPETPHSAYTNQSNDTFPVMLHLKAMYQYYEATQRADVIQSMLRATSAVYRELNSTPQCVRPAKGRATWPICGGHECPADGVCKCCIMSRYPDLVYVVHWLYEQTNKEWLLDMAELIHNRIGVHPNWINYFAAFNCTSTYDGNNVQYCGIEHLAHHGVDVALGIKYGAVWYRQSHNHSHVVASINGLNQLYKYHGQVSGVVAADEMLAGLSPQRGAETCSVVETLFSLEITTIISGDAKVADKLEQVAFNALPGFSTSNQWGHVYFQFPNQPRSRHSNTQTWYKSWAGPVPCCTANHVQGWPKFVSHLWALTLDPPGGLVALAYAPSTVKVEVQPDTFITVELDTDYPFRSQLNFDIQVTSKQKTFNVPLLLRHPSWCNQPVISVNGMSKTLETIPGSYFTAANITQGSITINLTLPMAAKFTTRYHNTVALERGPLVYSLPVDSEWDTPPGPSQSHPEPFILSLHNTSEWRYAVDVTSLRDFQEHAVADMPFDINAPAVTTTLNVHRLENWTAGIAPPFWSPQPSPQLAVAKQFVPYGYTMLRMTELPAIGTSPPWNDTTNLPGDDIIHGGMEMETGDPDACRQACLKQDHCKAWVFAEISCGTIGPPNFGRPWCWLKSAVGKSTRQSCFVSGILN